eukprot:6810732-Pyramimonas_sp.AAC.1
MASAFSGSSWGIQSRPAAGRNSGTSRAGGSPLNRKQSGNPAPSVLPIPLQNNISQNVRWYFELT